MADYSRPGDPDRGGPVRWLSITVYAQKENKRPIGYAAWPEEEPPAVVKKKKRKKK